MFSLNTHQLAIKFLLTSLAFLPIAFTATKPISAQSITAAEDGTGTVITTSDGQTYKITGGTLSGDGSNLFHSFEQLNLNANEIADFLSNPEIRNVLGRVVGGDASTIDGLIQLSGGNANLYLMNPAGFIFGNNASLNLPGAFTATTADGIGFDGGWFDAMGDNNYEALVGSPNSFAFTMSDPGSIVNAGDLAVTEGQSLTLLGGEVVNTGSLTAPGGNITIAAVPGESTVKISQAGMVLSLEIEAVELNQNAPKEVSPQSLAEMLTGGEEIAAATGVTVDADGTVNLVGSGDSIPQTAGTTIVSGNVDTSSSEGGNVNVLGSRVGLIDADINASGTNGGGTVLVGGDFQGTGTIPTAERTYVDTNSTINADAIDSGDGGQVIVWADEITSFNGNISSRGGSVSGDGGFVEVSGKDSLIFTGSVDTSAANGEFGTLLLDPKNIAIKPGTRDGDDDGSLENALGNDQNAASAEVLAGQPPLNGTFDVFESELEGMSGDTNIVLQANNNIKLNDLPDDELLFKPGSGTITFTADADDDGSGAFKMSSSDTIRAEGREIEISGAKLTVAGIDTSTDGNGGNITLLSSDKTIKVNGDINANSTGDGTGGDIRIEVTEGTGKINISSSGVAVTSTSVGGDGGNIDFLTAGNDIVTLNVDASAGGEGTGGNINYNIEPHPEVSGQIDTAGALIDASSADGDGGTVTMTTDTGDISTSGIDVSSGGDGVGGEIELTINNSTGAIDATNGTLTATSVNDDGGDITLTTDEGNIGANNVYTFSEGGTGGEIKLEIKAGGGSIDTTVGTLESTSTAGDGGKIELTTQGGNIATGSINSFTTESGSSGGEIVLDIQGSSGSIDTTVGTLASGTTAADGGEVSLSTENTTTGGNIQTATINTSSTGSGNGGEVEITAGEIGDIDTSNGVINSSSEAGDGGKVELTVVEGGISPGNINSTAGGDGSGGDIILEATSTPGLIDTSSSTLDSSSVDGDGGKIEIDTAGGNISTADLISRSEGSGNGGNIELNIDASDQRIGKVDTTAGTLDSSSTGGDGGEVKITTAEGGINVSTIDSGSNGLGSSGGDITLEIESSKASIDATTGNIISGDRQGSGGDISLSTAQGNISVGNLNSSSTASGTGGDISVEIANDFGDIDASTSIIDASSESGNGGNVSLSTAKGNIVTSSVLTLTNGDALGGNIMFTTDEAGSISTANGTDSKLDASSALGTGGDVNLESSNITVTTVDATGGLAGGNITFTGDETDITDGSTVASNGGDLQFRPFSIDQDIRVNFLSDGGADFLDITREEIDRIVDGFAVIEIGRADGTGTIFIEGMPDFPDPVIYLQPTRQQ